MQPIYKIGILIFILFVINYLHPLKNQFNIKNLTNPFNKNTDSGQINMIYKHINNLIVKNIDYNELINCKWNTKPYLINYNLEKIIIDYISTIFNNTNFKSHNIEIFKKYNYYILYKGVYIPNINFKIIIHSTAEEYTYIMDIELFIHNSNKIDIINLKINDVLNPNQINESNIDSIFIKAPINENYSEDSLIPTINNISE